MVGVAEYGLEGIALFAVLAPARRIVLERQCRFQRYAGGEEIIDRKAPSRDLFCIVRGAVRVEIHAPGGRDLSFEEIETGGHFGELSCLDGQPRSASVVAMVNTVVATVPTPALEQVLLENPTIALALMRRMAEIIRLATDRILDLSTLGANNRIYADLLRRARPSPGLGAKAGVIHPIPTHQDLAGRVSVTRETVTRALGDLARAQIVVKDGARLVVPDMEKLLDMVTKFRSDVVSHPKLDWFL
ncbi:MAG: Crp/Fnr family transcriptional regulator [Alphaproteobacteria bacterium]|nr:Crp/Fnr family transcriptional regulator [Alphaproteobacteria bacterium]